GAPRRRPDLGANGSGGPSQRLPLRAAVQGGHRAAAAPVRHPTPRRASQALPASRDGLVSGGGRRERRVLGSEPIHPPLQATRRRHAGAIPDARKNRLKAASRSKKRQSDPLTIPHKRGRRVGDTPSV